MTLHFHCGGPRSMCLVGEMKSCKLCSGGQKKIKKTNRKLKHIKIVCAVI